MRRNKFVAPRSYSGRLVAVIEKPSVVRIAAAADEDALYDLLVDLRQTGGPVARLLPYRPEKILAQIQLATRAQQGVIGVIDGPNGEAHASVGLFNHTPWWTDITIFVQLWLYARPATVGLGYGEALLRFVAWTQQSMTADIEKYARDHNEPPTPFYIENTHIGGHHLKALDRLFSKYGERVGSVFVAPRIPK